MHHRRKAGRMDGHAHARTLRELEPVRDLRPLPCLADPGGLLERASERAGRAGARHERARPRTRLCEAGYVGQLDVHPEGADVVAVAVDEDEVGPRVEDFVDPRAAHGASAVATSGGDVVVARDLGLLLRAFVAADNELISFDRHEIQLCNRINFATAAHADPFPPNRGGHRRHRISARSSATCMNECGQEQHQQGLSPRAPPLEID